MRSSTVRCALNTAGRIAFFSAFMDSDENRARINVAVSMQSAAFRQWALEEELQRSTRFPSRCTGFHHYYLLENAVEMHYQLSDRSDWRDTMKYARFIFKA